MSALGAALAAEGLKARRSRVLPLTAAAMLLLPLAGALFMVILADPARARELGLLGAKAQLAAGTSDWPGYFSVLAQGMAVGGSLVFAFVAAWTFGREFSGRTAKELLALPTSRTTIVLAKLVLALGWMLALAALALAVTLLLGVLLRLPGWSPSGFVEAAWRVGLVSALTAWLALPTAFAASAGRGYLPGLALALLALVLAQIATVIGWGEWFPWAVPALVGGAGGEAEARVASHAYAGVAAVGVAGAALTVWWWRSADQHV